MPSSKLEVVFNSSDTSSGLSEQALMTIGDSAAMRINTLDPLSDLTMASSTDITIVFMNLAILKGKNPDLPGFF